MRKSITITARKLNGLLGPSPLHLFTSSPLQPRRPPLSLILLSLTLLTIPGCVFHRVRTDAQTLRVPLSTEPTTLDPAMVEDGPTIDVLMHLYDGLVKWNEQNVVAPSLAERWEVSPDGLAYTFHLRHGARFQSGREVTAEDFRYSLNRCLSPALMSPVGGVYLNDILGSAEVLAGKAKECRGIEVLDRYTLRLRLDRPKAYFIGKLTYPTAYVVDRDVVRRYGEKWPEHGAGTGPFRLVKRVFGSSLTLEANPGYFGGKPKLQRIERPIVMDTATRHIKYESGEMDMTDVSMGDYDRDKMNPALARELHQYPRASVFYASMSSKVFPPFRDKRVRQAMNLAVDKDTLIRVVMGGLPQRADGILPPGLPGYDPHFVGLRYDVRRARQLLAEAGYPGGRGFPPLTLTFRERQQDMRRFAQVLAAMYKQNLGIEVRLKEMEWATFLAERNRGKLAFSYMRWMADYLDPQNFLSLLLHSKSSENRIGYNNPEFDRLCDEADGMVDAKKRLVLYQQAERIAVDDAYWIPLYFQKDVELWRGNVHGVTNTLFGHLPHVGTYLSKAGS
ncbi:MAG TPA: peptide ABC transporter substrate-binding protein [Armatimonadota bacterium]|jgi:ABC-type transport system substrate-binding protein